MSSAGDYRYYLEEMRHFKPHTLSEAEEKIVNIKDVTGAGALITLYDAITNRYVFKLDVDGETKELTRGQLMAYVQGTDPDLRAKAYQELYRVYGLPPDEPITYERYIGLIHPDDRAMIEETIAAAMVSHEPFAFDLRGRGGHLDVVLR